MKIGFVGLGNVGGKLAGSLLRNNFDLTVRDLDENLTSSFKDLGAKIANSAKELAEEADLIITCLPSPKICAQVMEGEDGILEGLSENKIWLEMSTTDEAEVKRIGEKVIEKKAIPLDGPVSGGCHRAATGNIAIFIGGDRETFEKILPALTTMGRKTGKEHSVWAKAVTYNDMIYFSRRNPNSDWLKNAIAHPQVKVEFDGNEFSGLARLVEEDELAQKISNEQKKITLRPKIFIQINLGEETQKSGINYNNIKELDKELDAGMKELNEGNPDIIEDLNKELQNEISINRFKKLHKN